MGSELDALRKARQGGGASRVPTAAPKSGGSSKGPTLSALAALSGKSGSKPSGGGRSLFGQATDIVSAVPGGLAHLAGGAWDSTVGNLGAAAAAATGQSAADVRRMSPIGRALVNETMLESVQSGEGWRDNIEKALPLFNEIGASATDTVGRVTDQAAALAPGGKAAGDGAYAKANREGRILSVLLEDVGNAALFGGAGAQAVAGGGRAAAASRAGASPRVAGRAALTANEGLPVAGRIPQAAERAAQGARLVDEGIGKAMLAPFTVPAKAAGRSAGKLITNSDRYRQFRNESAFGRAMDFGAVGRGAEGAEFREKIASLDALEGEFVAKVAEASRRSLQQFSPAEAIAGRLKATGLADALAPLAELDPELRGSIVQRALESTEFKVLVEGADEATVAEAFDLAVRSTVEPKIAARLAEEGQVWTEVDAERGQFYKDQLGILDPRDPDFIAMLAGDAALPFERNRVAAKRVPRIERILRDIEASQKRQDRARGRVRFDDGAGGKTMAARGKAMNSLAKKLVDTEGADSLIPLLRDLEPGASTKQVRKAVRNEIYGRAELEARGLSIPQDVISDYMHSNGIEAAPRPSMAGSAQAAREVGKEAVATVAGKDANRLYLQRISAEQKAERLADAATDTIAAREAKLKGPLGRLKAQIKNELREDRNVRQSASAAARLESELRAGTLAESDMRQLVTDVRKGALPLLDAAVKEAQGRVDQWWEGAINYKALPAGERAYFIDAMNRETGMTPKQWSQARIGQGKVFRDDSPVHIDVLGDSLTEARGSRGAGWTEQDIIDVIVPELAEYISLKDQARYIKDGKIVRRTVKEPDPGDPRKMRAVRNESGLPKLTYNRVGGGVREFLDPDNNYAGVPELVQAMMDDPELAAAVFSEDPVGAVRELQAAQFDEGFSSVKAEAEALVADLYRDFADQAEAKGIVPDGKPDLAAGREMFLETATNRKEAAAMAAQFDAAVAKIDQGGAKLNSEVPLRNVGREVYSQGARRGVNAGRQAGDAAGAARILERQEGQARRRAARMPDDVEGAQFDAAAEAHGRGFQQGQAEGRRIREVERFEKEQAALYRKLGKEQQKFMDELAAAGEKVTTAPAKYRVALNGSRAMASVVDEMLADGSIPAQAEGALRKAQAELVTSVVDSLDLLDPEHIASGRVGKGTKSGPASGARKAQAEYLREGAVPSMTPTDQGVLIARNMNQLVRNAFAKWIIDRHGGVAGDFVDAARLVDGDGAPLRGQDLLDAVNANSDVPMVPWNPRTPFDPVRDAGPTTTFVPQWTRDAFDGKYKAAGNVEKMMRTLVDAPTRVWKHDVLALSPRWHLGNMVGNMLMAWAAGVPPHRMVMLAKDAWRMTKDGSAPTRLKAAGVGAEQGMFFNWAQELSETPGAVPSKRALRMFEHPNNRVQGKLLSRFDADSKVGRAANVVTHPISQSYKMNGWVDDFTHNLVYLDRMKKGASPEQAIKDSLKVAGDFSNMSRFERSVVRRILPFYSWMRHITGLTAHLAVNHPLRSVWTLHLWTLMAEDDEQFGDIASLRGAIQTGDNQFIRGANYMPFGTVMDFDFTNPVATIGGSANPFLKLGLEAGTGIEFGPSGMEPMSRTPGTGHYNEWGNEVFGPLSPSEFGHRAIRTFPTGKLFQQLRTSGDDRVVRYDTGDPVSLKGEFGRHTIPNSNEQGNAEIIFRNRLGLPLPSETKVEEIRARLKSKNRQNNR